MGVDRREQIGPGGAPGGASGSPEKPPAERPPGRPPPERGVAPGTSGPPLPAERQGNIRRALGWASFPSFIWKRIPVEGRARPTPIRSILHTGYAFSAAALLVDAGLWLVVRLPGARLFLPLHLLSISLLTSLLLLHPRFLEHLDGRPIERLGWANRLTLARLCLLPVLVYLLLVGYWEAGLAGYILLGLTDVADGLIARRRHEETKIGFVLDPFADILFHAAILASLWWNGILSDRTILLVAGRYGLLLLGCAILYLTKGEIWIQPTPFGKSTGIAISAITGLFLLGLGLGKIGPQAQAWLDGLLSVFFAACLVHVFVIGWINFRRPPQGGRAVFRRGWGLRLGPDRGTDRDGQG